MSVAIQMSANENNESRESDEYLAMVYRELRQLAQNRLANETPGQTLSATALVHETYLRICQPGSENKWDSTGHFFGAAAESMKRILIDNARRKATLRRGSGRKRIDFATAELALNMSSDHARGILDLTDSLDVFEQKYPKEAKLVQLRFFAGLTMEEAAEVLCITRRTAQRYWAFAKAVLYQIMNEDE